MRLQPTKKDIKSFFNSKKIAIAGVSRSPQKFGYMVYRDMLKKNYPVLPVNPNTTEILGHTCYTSVSGLPDDTDAIVILTPANQTANVIEEALAKGIKKIWIQQKSESPEAFNLLDDKDITLIAHNCIFMFMEPVTSIHKVHRWMKSTFGKMPA